MDRCRLWDGTLSWDLSNNGNLFSKMNCVKHAFLQLCSVFLFLAAVGTQSRGASTGLYSALNFYLFKIKTHNALFNIVVSVSCPETEIYLMLAHSPLAIIPHVPVCISLLLLSPLDGSSSSTLPYILSQTRHLVNILTYEYVQAKVAFTRKWQLWFLTKS